MSKSLLIWVAASALIAAFSGGLAYFHAAQMANPKDVAAKGFEAVRRSGVIFYSGVGFFVGAAGYFVYPSMSPDRYLLLAGGIAVALSLGALLMFRRSAKEMILMHLVYAAGFGWIVPLLLRA